MLWRLTVRPKARDGSPRIAIVAWKLGAELERAIEDGSGRFSFVVVSMLLSERLRELVEWHRMPLLRLSSFRLEWATFYMLAGARLARIEADLVHTIGPTPIIPNRVDLNTVTFCHAAYHEPAAAESIRGTSIGWQLGEPTARRLERWWFERRVRVLAALSVGSAADLRRYYPNAEVIVLPRGLDFERFKPDAGSRAELREELSVGPAEIVALFVDQEARPLKGLEQAIEGVAAARRAERGPDQLWVLGDQNERYAPLARRLDVGDVVRFFGRRPDLERFYQAADIFVLPTVYETFSRSAHEAAACGLPIVAPSVSGVRELIGEDEAGIVVERSAADVARALMTLTADADLRARLGDVARRRSAAFGIEASAKRILDVYESLCRRGQPARDTGETARTISS
jgi:glycosyltransferase involved in cell wall biosynthesis